MLKKNDILFLITAAALLSAGLRFFFFKGLAVESNSMFPLLQQGDLIIILKKNPFFRLHTGDLAVCRLNPGQALTCRLAGRGNLIIKRAVRIDESGIFLLGDNYTNSLDSRVFGTVSSGQIVGKALLIIYPLRRAGFLAPRHKR